MLRQAIAADTALGKIASSYIEVGKLVPDSVVLQMVGKRLAEPECRQGFLLDGFPRTLCQAEALDEFLALQGAPLDVALELAVPHEELVQRLSERGREDDDPGVVRQRLRQFEVATKPLLDYYADRNLLRTVDGTGSPEEVFERIKSVLDQTRRSSSDLR